MFALTWPRRRLVFDVPGWPGGKRVRRRRDERVGRVRDGRDVDHHAGHVGARRDDVGHRRQHRIGTADRQRQAPVGGQGTTARPTGRRRRRAGVEDAAGADRDEPSTGVGRVGIVALGDPTEHVDGDVGGGGALRGDQVDRHLTVRAGADDGEVRNVLALAEVDERRHAGARTGRRDRQVARCRRIDHGDVEHDREHVAVRPGDLGRNAALAEHVDVERRSGGATSAGHPALRCSHRRHGSRRSGSV